MTEDEKIELLIEALEQLALRIDAMERQQTDRRGRSDRDIIFMPRYRPAARPRRHALH